MGEKLSERNSPVYLTNEDTPIIENSGKFFARKFDETIDPSVVDYFAKKVKLGANTTANLLAN